MVNSIDFSSRLGGSKWSILMNYYDFSTRERRSKGSIILNFLIFRLVDQEKRHNGKSRESEISSAGRPTKYKSRESTHLADRFFPRRSSSRCRAILNYPLYIYPENRRFALPVDLE